MLEDKSCAKIKILKVIIYLILAILLLISIVFICCGLFCECVDKDLFIGLGTGAATSFVVSGVFYLINELNTKMKELKNRDKFIFDFKSLLYRSIDIIDFASLNDGEYDFQQYLKEQHRWFHNYVKKMDANADTDGETQKRLTDLTNYINSEEFMYRLAFGSPFLWRNSGFNKYQIIEIESLYKNFETLLISLKNQQLYRLFLTFSEIFDDINRTLDLFSELESFKLLKINIKNGRSEIIYKNFEEKEPLFKFIREFNNIRHENNLKINEQKCK